MSDEKPMGQVVRIDEARIRDHLGEMVRGTVEETLNAMLDAEADELCGAGRYERSKARQDTRAGSYERTLQTSAGDVNLKIPKLRRQTFETAIIERYRRRESSVEEALIEMYLAGISVRRVEDITEALWGTRVSPSTVSNLNKKIYAKIEAWRNRRIEGEHPYLYLDGIVMKRTWAGEVRNVSLLVASAVNSEGFREILGICEGAKEDKSGWSAFLRHLVDRGLKGVQLIISDASPTTVTTRVRSRPISGTATFRTRRAIPPWRPSVSRGFFEIDANAVAAAKNPGGSIWSLFATFRSMPRSLCRSGDRPSTQQRRR